MEKKDVDERILSLENEHHSELIQQENQLLREKLLAVERKIEGAARYINFLENFLYRLVRELIQK